MLYLLQVDVLVTIAILLPFFALYLTFTVLRLGYFGAIRFVHMVKARIPRAAFGDVMGDNGNAAKRPLAIVAVMAPAEKALFDTTRRSARRVA
jgi:RNA recognition motif